MYKENSVLPPESACCSIQDRAIEYKALRFCTLDKNDNKYIEKPLVDRLGKFLVACMNSRVNGTISFGVVDSIEDDTQSHGCVKGIKIAKDMRSVIIGIVDKHFFREESKAVPWCPAPTPDGTSAMFKAASFHTCLKAPKRLQ